jgi:predicted DNA-binding transcriptional regulator AlpA
MDDALLKVPEIAAMTREPIDTIRWYRHRQSAGYDEGPRMFKLGKAVVAKQSDVLAWIERQYAAASVPSRGPDEAA